MLLLAMVVTLSLLMASLVAVTLHAHSVNQLSSIKIHFSFKSTTYDVVGSH